MADFSNLPPVAQHAARLFGEAVDLGTARRAAGMVVDPHASGIQFSGRQFTGMQTVTGVAPDPSKDNGIA